MSLLRRHSAWLWLSVLLLIVAVLTVLSSTTGGSDTPLSLDSAAPDGGLALQMWLSRIGYGIQRQDSYGLPTRAETLVVLEPKREPSRREAAALLGWARGGGRLVIISDETFPLLSTLGRNIDFARPAGVRVTQPALLRPVTSRLSGTADVITRFNEDMGSVAATRHGTVVSRERWGSGEMWALTAPNLLDNAHIARAQNRRLALNLVGSPGTIVVDQPGPAAAGGSTYWLSGTAWGIAVLFGLGILMLFRWLGGWRLGPPLIPFSERRRPAVEYVLSLAVLLRRAHRRAEVLAIYQRELRERLRQRFGTDALEALPRDVAEAVRPLLERQSDLSEEALIRQAEAIVRCEEALKERV